MKTKNKQTKKIERGGEREQSITIFFFFLSLKEDVCQLVDMPNTCTSGHKSNEHDLNAIKF